MSAPLILALALLAAPGDSGAAAPAVPAVSPRAVATNPDPLGISFGGYAEVLFESPDRRRQDGSPSGAVPTLGLVRGFITLGYRFRDDLVFDTQLEFQRSDEFDEPHVERDPLAGGGEADRAGESTLELAYLEWSRRPGLGVRAGKLLVPMGLTNEVRDPLSLPAARRPEVEEFILPTTWTAEGAGLFGRARGGVTWSVYGMEGLNGAGFTAAGGIRDGSGATADPLHARPAITGRLDWNGRPGMLVGISGYTCDAWPHPQPAGIRLAPRVWLGDAHLSLQWRRLSARALYANGHIEQNERLSNALGLTGTQRLGEFFFGGYAEAACEVLPWLAPRSEISLRPYARYEEYDTQDGINAPGAEDPAYHHTITTAGFAVAPHPNVVIKADRQWRHNEARTGVGQWDLAVAYGF